MTRWVLPSVSNLVQEIRITVRELDTTAREIYLVLQQIHQEDGLSQSKYTFKSINFYLTISRLNNMIFSRRAVR